MYDVDYASSYSLTITDSLAYQAKPLIPYVPHMAPMSLSEP